MSKTIRTQYNHEEVDSNDNYRKYFDLEKEPSLTDPSQAMEPKDILNVFTRGGAVRVLQPQVLPEVIPQEFSTIVGRLNQMDKTERAEASIKMRAIIEEKAEKLDHQRNK